MDSRPATQASTGRHLLRSAIAEAVASDPAQRVVASTGAPVWRSRTPIWVGLGAVVALTAAVIIGTMLRTGTPGGVTSATSAPAAAATPSAQAPAMHPAPRRPALRSPPPTPEPPSAPGTRLRSARAAATGPPARATASTADCSSPHRPGVPSAARVCRTRPAVPSRSLSPNACSPPKAGRPGPPAPASSACADQSRSLPLPEPGSGRCAANASRTPDRRTAPPRGSAT